MKSGKKRGKVKPKKHRVGKRLTYVIVAIAAIILCFLVYSTLNPQNPVQPDQTPKAAIIDHLSISQPNPDFRRTVETILNETNLEVDYFSGEDVTVDFYRNLPSQNYRLIIFRAHSTGECSVEGQPPFIVFFTSEPYSNVKHVSDQLAMHVVYVNFPGGGSPGYFGVTPTFINDCMKGTFNDTIIIAMGCDGLKYTSMAEAFIEKGARTYISWNGPVSAPHTDLATATLLHHLITEKQTVKDAVAETMKEVGPDPNDKSLLTFHPDEAGNYVIPFSSEETTLDLAGIHKLLGDLQTVDPSRM